MLIQVLDDFELFFHARIGNHLDAIGRGNHRENRQIPALPLRIIAVGRQQFTQVAKGPRYLIAITFVIAILLHSRAQNIRN